MANIIEKINGANNFVLADFKDITVTKGKKDWLWKIKSKVGFSTYKNGVGYLEFSLSSDFINTKVKFSIFKDKIDGYTGSGLGMLEPNYAQERTDDGARFTPVITMNTVNYESKAPSVTKFIFLTTDQE